MQDRPDRKQSAITRGFLLHHMTVFSQYFADNDFCQMVAKIQAITVWLPVKKIDMRKREGTCFTLISGQRSEEHTSELQSLMRISYAVFCLKKKKTTDLTSIITDTSLLLFFS